MWDTQCPVLKSRTAQSPSAPHVRHRNDDMYLDFEGGHSGCRTCETIGALDPLCTAKK